MILHSNLSRGYCQVTVWLMLSFVSSLCSTPLQSSLPATRPWTF